MGILITLLDIFHSDWSRSKAFQRVAPLVVPPLVKLVGPRLPLAIDLSF